MPRRVALVADDNVVLFCDARRSAEHLRGMDRVRHVVISAKSERSCENILYGMRIIER